MANEFIIKNGLIVNEGGAKITGSLNATTITGSLQGTASFAYSSSATVSSSYSVTSSYSQTSSYAPAYLPLTGGTITGNVTVNGTASIAFLNVTYESSSVIISTGSNVFGDASNDSQTLYGTVTIPTGSFSVSGSTRITGSLNVTAGITGSLLGTSSWANTSSVAITASYYLETDPIFVGKSGSLATTGSNIFVGGQTITGSLTLSGSTHTIAGIISSSDTIYVGVTQPTLALDTRGRILYSNFFSTTGSLPSASLYHGMFAHVHSEGAAYYSHGSNGWVRLWDTFNNSGLISGSQVVENIANQAIAPLSVSASLFVSASNFAGSGSGIIGVITSSFAKTASYYLETDPIFVAKSASLATTGSNVFIGNQTITGSVFITGSSNLLGNSYHTGSVYHSGSKNLIGVFIQTGSLNISGSTTQIGNNTLLGNTTLSGSIIISGALGTGTPTVRIYGDTQHDGYVRFSPVTTNINSTISASYIYVSGSTNDLYFSQNGAGYTNTTRLRWLEGNLYTGLLNGGIISASLGTNTFTIHSGSGIIVNLNATIGANPYPTVQYLNWADLTGTIDALSASYDQSFVSVLSNGTIGTQGTPYNDGDYNTKIPIGIVIHQNRSTINAAQTFPGVAYGWKQRSFDFIKAFGPLKIAGYTLAQSGSSTGSLVLSGGTAWVDGRNYTVDPSNPSYIVEATGIATSKIYRYRQSGSGWAYDTNGGAGYAVIDPANYSNNGVLTPVGTNDWTIQRVFYFPNSATKAFYIYYGNATYSSQANALAAVSTETFSEAPNTAANAIYVGYMILRYNADFTVPASYAFYQAGLFRSSGAGGGAGGGGGATTLGALDDVTITSPTDYQPLVYNSLTTHWENRSTISASLAGNANSATSASYAATASLLLGSVQSASYAYTASYVAQAQTASYVLQSISASYSQTASYILQAVSSSYSQTASYVAQAQTASYVLQAVSSSYAATASYFITGSVTSASYASTASYSSYAVTVNKKVRTQIPFIATQGQTVYITNIPAAVDEIGTELRVKENLSSVASCSLSAKVEVATGGAIGFLKVQYSTNESTWNDFNSNKIDLGTASTQLTAEEPIPIGAKTTNTFLRLVTSDGDGVGSSNARFGNVILNLIYDI